MVSIKFPDMFNRSTTNLTYDIDASSQNLSMTLYSNKGEMFGDPYYGSNLKKFLFDQKDVILEDLVIDDINSAIKLYMPQLSVTRNDISMVSSNKGEIAIKVKAVNKADFTVNTYYPVLMENEA